MGGLVDGMVRLVGAIMQVGLLLIISFISIVVTLLKRRGLSRRGTVSFPRRSRPRRSTSRAPKHREARALGRPAPSPRGTVSISPQYRPLGSGWRFPAYPEDWSQRARAIKDRDGWRCRRCGASGQALHVHHIVSLSRGGTNEPDNLITLCETCHSEYHPHMQRTMTSSSRSQPFVSVTERDYALYDSAKTTGVDRDSHFGEADVASAILAHSKRASSQVATKPDKRAVGLLVKCPRCRALVPSEAKGCMHCGCQL